MDLSMILDDDLWGELTPQQQQGSAQHSPVRPAPASKQNGKRTVTPVTSPHRVPVAKAKPSKQQPPKQPSKRKKNPYIDEEAEEEEEEEDEDDEGDDDEEEEEATNGECDSEGDLDFVNKDEALDDNNTDGDSRNAKIPIDLLLQQKRQKLVELKKGTPKKPEKRPNAAMLMNRLPEKKPRKSKAKKEEDEDDDNEEDKGDVNKKKKKKVVVSNKRQARDEQPRKKKRVNDDDTDEEEEDDEEREDKEEEEDDVEESHNKKKKTTTTTTKKKTINEDNNNTTIDLPPRPKKAPNIRTIFDRANPEFKKEYPLARFVGCGEHSACKGFTKAEMKIELEKRAAETPPEKIEALKKAFAQAKSDHALKSKESKEAIDKYNSEYKTELEIQAKQKKIADALVCYSKKKKKTTTKKKVRTAAEQSAAEKEAQKLLLDVFTAGMLDVQTTIQTFQNKLTTVFSIANELVLNEKEEEEEGE